MRVLSATEAVGPAWERTKQILLQPFKLTTFLKLCLVGLLASCGGFNFSSSNFHHQHGLPPVFQATMLMFSALFGLIALVVSLVLFYAGSRMQFVLFEITAMRETTVAPKWQRYAPVTWRWIGLKLLYLCIAGAVVLISAIPLVIAIIHLIHSGADMHGFHAVLRVMLQLLMPIALVGVTMMVMGLIYQMIVDFVMPVMALENASISESVSRAAGNLRGDVGGVLAYVLMRFVLGFGVGMATILAFALAVVAAGIPLVLIGAALFFGLHKAGITGHVLMGTGFGLEGLVGLGWLVFCCLALNGFVAFFNRAYSMYFYGGRYPALGAILEPVYAGILQAEPPPVEPPMPEPPPTPFS